MCRHFLLRGIASPAMNVEISQKTIQVIKLDGVEHVVPAALLHDLDGQLWLRMRRSNSCVCALLGAAADKRNPYCQEEGLKTLIEKRNEASLLNPKPLSALAQADAKPKKYSRQERTAVAEVISMDLEDFGQLTCRKADRAEFDLQVLFEAGNMKTLMEYVRAQRSEMPQPPAKRQYIRTGKHKKPEQEAAAG